MAVGGGGRHAVRVHSGHAAARAAEHHQVGDVVVNHVDFDRRLDDRGAGDGGAAGAAHLVLAGGGVLRGAGVGERQSSDGADLGVAPERVLDAVLAVGVLDARAAADALPGARCGPAVFEVHFARFQRLVDVVVEGDDRDAARHVPVVVGELDVDRRAAVGPVRLGQRAA